MKERKGRAEGGAGKSDKCWPERDDNTNPRSPNRLQTNSVRLQFLMHSQEEGFFPTTAGSLIFFPPSQLLLVSALSEDDWLVFRAEDGTIINDGIELINFGAYT